MDYRNDSETMNEGDQISKPAFDSTLDQPKEGGGGIAKIIIVVLAILIVGGGAYAAYDYFGGSEKQPKEVLSKMFENSFDLNSGPETVSFLGAMNFNLMDSGNNILVMSFDFEGTSQSAEENMGSADMTLGGDFEIDVDGSSFSFAVSVDLRQLDDQSYFKLNSLDVNSSGSSGFEAAMIAGMVEGFSEPLKDQWISIDLSDIEENPLIGAQPYSSASPEDVEKILQIINEEIKVAGLFEVLEDFGTEKVRGVSSHHYKLEILLPETLDAYSLILKRMLEEGLIESPDPTVDLKDLDLEIAEFREELVASGVDNPVLEVWIGKKDYLLRKVTVPTYVIDMEKITPEIQGGGEDSLSFSMSMEYFDYGEPVDIVAPADARNLEEIMQEMFGGLFMNDTGMQGMTGDEMMLFEDQF